MVIILNGYRQINLRRFLIYVHKFLLFGGKLGYDTPAVDDLYKIKIEDLPTFFPLKEAHRGEEYNATLFSEKIWFNCFGLKCNGCPINLFKLDTCGTCNGAFREALNHPEVKRILFYMGFVK